MKQKLIKIFLSKHYLFYILLLGIIASLILNLVPVEYIPRMLKVGYFAHILNYAFLSFIMLFLTIKMDYKYKISLTLFIIIILSTLIEFFQLLTTHRGFELYDIFANIFGVILGIIFGLYILKVVRKEANKMRKSNLI